MKSNIYVVSCDWYAVACQSLWCYEKVQLSKHERERLDSRIEMQKPERVEDYQDELPNALRELLLQKDAPRSFVGMIFEYGAEKFKVEASLEFNPAYKDAAMISWNGRPLAHLFWNPRNPNVDCRSCQAKVANSALYSSVWPTAFRSMLRAIGWQFVRVVRIDVCADFEYFANGRLPLKFAQDYLSRPTSSRPSFIRKSSNKFRTAGVKAFDRLLWETISWGTRESAVQVNLYNKTQELIAKQDKAYIREKWESYGLPSDISQPCKRFVWRVEFSINPSAKFVFDKVTKACRELLQNDVATQANLDNLFAALLPDYFQFYYMTPADRKAGRRVKDLQPVVLFADVDRAPFKLRSYTHHRVSGRTERILMKRLESIITSGNCNVDELAGLKFAYSHLQDEFYVKNKQGNGELTADEILTAFFRELPPAKSKHIWLSQEEKNRELRRFVAMLIGTNNAAAERFTKGWHEFDSYLAYLNDQLAEMETQLPEWFFDAADEFANESDDEKYWKMLEEDMPQPESAKTPRTKFEIDNKPLW